MSRSGLTEFDGDDVLSYGRWRGAVARSIRGRRGQRMLRELLQALEEMPNRELHDGVLVDDAGCCCALGALLIWKGIEGDFVHPAPDRSNDFWADEMDEVNDGVAGALDVADSLVDEIAYINDEVPVRHLAQRYGRSVEHQRWHMVHDWVEARIYPKEAACGQ